MEPVRWSRGRPTPHRRAIHPTQANALKTLPLAPLALVLALALAVRAEAQRILYDAGEGQKRSARDTLAARRHNETRAVARGDAASTVRDPPAAW